MGCVEGVANSVLSTPIICLFDDMKALSCWLGKLGAVFLCLDGRIVKVSKRGKVMISKYFNPYTDFGFKKLFGEEASKDLLIDFL